MDVNAQGDKMNIKVSGTVTLDDLKQFNFSHLMTSLKRKRTKISLILLVICIAFIVLLELPDLVSGKKNYFNSIIFYISIMIIVFPVLFFVNINVGSKKSFESNLTLQQEQTISISDEGIILERKDSISKFEWNQIYNIVSYKNAMYFYIANNQAIIVQKRYFLNDETFDKFKKDIQNINPTTAST